MSGTSKIGSSCSHQHEYQCWDQSSREPTRRQFLSHPYGFLIGYEHEKGGTKKGQKLFAKEKGNEIEKSLQYNVVLMHQW